MISLISLFTHAFTCSLLRINLDCVNRESESCHGLKLKVGKKFFPSRLNSHEPFNLYEAKTPDL